ncbi:MAG: glycoside hydrolase family protein [Planctomycetota bacterium]
MNSSLSRRGFLAAGAAALASPPAAAALASPAGSPKKGACFVVRDGNGWRSRVTKLNAKWHYSWGSNKPADMPSGIEYCPMIWGDGRDDKLASVLERLKQQYENDEIRYLMGFNEPDSANQSNMSVERVVDLWPQLMETGIPLVSPGCVHPDREWMRNFMGLVEQQNLRVDFIAVHSYGGPNPEALVKRLEKVHREFGRPLWITEFAVGDWRAKKAEENRHSPETIVRFMRELLPALEELDFVKRYAWFSAKQTNRALGTSALFDMQGGLTQLGEIYAAA